MSDEKLNLIAKVQDGMTPALRKIKDTLNSIHKSPGMEAATDGMKRLGEQTAKFATFGGNASEALGAIGLGGLTAAGSLAGVVVQMRALGDRSLQMKELARETKVSVDWLNVWSHAGLSFGVSAEAMQSSLNHLAGEMPGLISKSSKLYFLLSQRFPTFTTKFLSEDTEQQIKDITELLNSSMLKRNPQLQKMLANDFFGNGDEVEKLFRDGAKGFWDEFQKQQKQLNKINPELMAQAKAFRDAQIGFNDALENFENRVGPGFLKTMTEIVKRSSAIFGDPDAVKAYDQHFEEQRKWFHDEISAAEKALHLKGDDKGPSGTPTQTAPGALQGQDQLNKSLNDSFSKINPLFHKSAYITDGVADGTKAGVLAAFRELMVSGDAASTGSGGLLQASYETGGGSVGGFRSGGAAGAGRAIRRYENSQSNDEHYNAPTGSSAGNLTKLMDAASKKYGLDPRILEGIRAGESGHGSRYDIGDLHNGPAYGPLQLNVGRGRLGWKFEHDTGLDLRDPRTIPAQVDWVAKYIRKRLAENPHYNPGGEWFGFHGLRNANPRWGDSGYAPDRKATSLTPRPGAGAGGTRGVDGHIRADIHVHGNAHKATVRARNIEARLHRWPSMEMG